MKDIRLVSDFVTRWFRDSADRDYVCARAAYRNEFNEQFRLCSLQAVQKYLLAILLYNGCSARALGPEDTSKALERVQAIADIGFDVPSDVSLFIHCLGRYGNDRYMRHADSIPLTALLTLDKTVWHVRRFCMRPRPVRAARLPNRLPSGRALRPSEPMPGEPHKLRLPDGFLERALDQRLACYRDLTWKNVYFGRNRKPEGKRPRFRVTSMVPEGSVTQEEFEALRELLDFPPHIAELYGAGRPPETLRSSSTRTRPASQ